ncbi:membrane protein [Xenorhabdus khoisanae]|uniref:Membrane protein n=1 Tax=Xenorhabdus khoisanae TaxID=880157 RepID=A0A0J5FNX3_9GAMM|nr:O-antigen polymerase [Xenorhabdus khoisanae]KMJ43652.1 membrane protein [Xenorhabdus khoisanae]
MIYFTTLSIFFIIVVLIIINKNNLFSPSVLLPLVVICTLCPVLFIKGIFYSPSIYSLLYITACIITFSCFSFIFENISINKVEADKSLFFNKRLYYLVSIVSLLLCSLMLKAYLDEIVSFNSFSHYAEYYRAVSTSGEYDLKNNVNYLVRNADMIALPLSVIGLYIWSTRCVSLLFKLTVITFLIFSFLLPIFSVARSGAIRASIVLLGVVIVFFHLRWKFAVFLFGFIFVLYTGAGFIFGYGSGGYDNLSDSLGYFFISFLRYLSGGYFAFDHYLLGNVNIFFRFAFFDSLFNKFDSVLDTVGFIDNCTICYPENYVDFVQVGPGYNFVSNVYTAFGVVFSNMGWGGVFYFGVTGAIMGTLYSQVRKGNVFFSMIYCFLLPGILLISFSEYFFAQIPIILRFVFLYFILFKLKPNKSMG